MPFHRRLIIILGIILAVTSVIGIPLFYRKYCDARRSYLVERCRVLRSAQRWDDLQVLTAGWTGWDSSNGEAWMFHGQAALGRKQWSEAATDFWHVPDSDPYAIPAMIEVSKLAFTVLNDPLQGVAACQRILKIDPHAAGAQKQLIGFYATTLQRQELLHQIHAAIEAKSEPREAYVDFFLLYTLRSKDAVEVNERWLKTYPKEELFLVARVIQMPESTIESKEAPTGVVEGKLKPVTAGRSKQELVEELLKRFPNNLELLAYKIEERIETGDASAVAELLTKAPDTGRRDNRFWRFQGWLHESNNEIEEAIGAYHQALELHSADWNTMNRLAVVERRRQNVAEVERLMKLVERGNEIRQALRKLKTVESVTPSILVEMAKLLRDSGDKSVAPALEHRLGLTPPN